LAFLLVRAVLAVGVSITDVLLADTVAVRADELAVRAHARAVGLRALEHAPDTRAGNGNAHTCTRVTFKHNLHVVMSGLNVSDIKYCKQKPQAINCCPNGFKLETLYC